MKDPYSVLGVPKNAKTQEIKSAFRKLAKQYHPDLYPNDEKAKERFSEINQAYEILGDKDKKARYDRGEIDAEGKAKFHGFDPRGFGSRGFEDGFQRDFNFQRGGGNPFNTSDIFRNFFGKDFGDSFGMGGGQRRTNEAASGRKGSDIKATLQVTLEQLVSHEKIAVTFSDGKTLKITLPNYIEDGQIIRLRGQGMEALGGVSGDALLTVYIKKHAKFRLEGRALYYDLSLPLKEAILGTRAEIETLEGPIGLKIPAWTNGGKMLRLKEKGLPLKKGGRGDFFVRINIILPEEEKTKLTIFAQDNL